jgi:hypothetical protein
MDVPESVYRARGYQPAFDKQRCRRGLTGPGADAVRRALARQRNAATPGAASGRESSPGGLRDPWDGRAYPANLQLTEQFSGRTNLNQ